MAPFFRTLGPTRTLTVTAGLSLAIALSGALPATAGAAAHSAHRSTSTDSAAGSLPAVSHATTLSAEPVIHSGKGRPPTKLLTKNLVTGTGEAATAKSTVTVKYVGADYTNGKDFTSSTWATGQAASFSLTQVVAGFAQGITGMKVGGRREIVIPPALGYGDNATGPIKVNETLVFVVDLESVSGS